MFLQSHFKKNKIETLKTNTCECCPLEIGSTQPANGSEVIGWKCVLSEGESAGDEAGAGGGAGSWSTFTKQGKGLGFHLG